MQRVISQAEYALRNHPKTATAAVVALLMGTGVTAFGVVAPSPEAMLEPKRLIVEKAQPNDLIRQIEAIDQQPIELYRTDVSRRSDTSDAFLRRLGVEDEAALAFVRKNAEIQSLLNGQAGRVAQATVKNGELVSLVLRGPSSNDEGDRPTQFKRIFVEAKSAVDGQTSTREFQTRVELAPYETRTRLKSGVIKSSLFAASDEAFIPDGVTSQIAEIFGTHIDFRKDLRRGDQFSVLYESLIADGEAAPWTQGSGRVVAARFINKDKPHEALWFQPEGKKGAYFDFEGNSSVHQFLSSPLEFSRVTSGFSMRFHPILNQWRAHTGVDFGAPTGTPVRSVGDGVVSFAGTQSGYGNIIIIKHSDNRETRFAHLSRINVRVGQKVAQGEFIGAVGATGWATGPHLHFEFRINGEAKDPLIVARESETQKLDAKDMAQFKSLATTFRAQLESANSAVASANHIRFE